MAKSGIYKITNLINNQCYIGKSIDIDRRFSEHHKMDRKADVYDALREYGIENFTFEIIELCDETKLNEREKYWIAYYDSYNNGYNMTSGGEGGYVKNGHKVIQYDLDGNFIAIYNSILEAERQLGIKTKASNISGVCKGKNYEDHGYQWRFLDDIQDPYQNIGKSLRGEKCKEGGLQTALQKNHKIVKKIAKCDKDTKQILKVYNSVKEASIDSNVCITNIYRVCKGERKSAGGYFWIYID